MTELVATDCNCSERDATEEKRLRYGVNLHSPYCPVGAAEREEGQPLVPPLVEHDG